MSTVQPSTDLMMVNRGGTDYKATVDRIPALPGTDLVLVNRGGVNYKCPVSSIASLPDTDLLLVNRGGVDYYCTAAAIKATLGPSVTSVVLSDVAGGNRFASVAFPVLATLSDIADSVKLKVWATGKMPRIATTSPILTVDSYSQEPTYQATCTNMLGADGMFDGNATNNWASCLYGQTALWDASSYNLPAGNVRICAQCPSDGSSALGVNGGLSSISSGNGNPFWYNYGTITLTSVRFTYGCGVLAVEVGGKILISGNSSWGLTLTDDTDLSTIQANDTWIKSTGSSPTGKVTSLSPGTNQIFLSGGSGTLSPGDMIAVPARRVTDNVDRTQYFILDSNGVISGSPGNADPGFVTWSANKTDNNYNGTATFPATLNGVATDTYMPAGTSLTVAVQAVKGLATASGTSNTITPA